MTMKALLIPVGEEPREIEVEGLADLQALVDGHIDAVGWVFNDAPTLYVNDEGKVNGMLPNRAVYVTAEDAGCQKWDGGTWAEGEVLDILYGPIVAVGLDPRTGEDRDILPEEADRVHERFSGSVEAVNSGAIEYLNIVGRSR